MRLLLVNRDFQSGQTTHVDALAAALTARGLSVAVARYDALTEPMPASARAGVPQLRFTDTASLARLAQRFQPDLIHAHSSSTWPLVAQVATRLARPLVVTAHGRGVDIPQNRAALRQARAVIVPGPATARSIGVPTVCIPNGVDLRRFTPCAKAIPPIIAYIGRVDATRAASFRVFCDATRQLPAEIWFLGSGAASVPRHVRALGWRADLERLLPRITIACAVGRSLREAQACGALGLVLGERYHGPVLHADLPAEVTDVWYGEHLAAVVPAQATVRLRGDLLTLLSAPARLRALQRESRGIAERFSDLAEKVERHHAVYRQVIEGVPVAASTYAPTPLPTAPPGDRLLGAPDATRLDHASPPFAAHRVFALRLIQGCDLLLFTLLGRSTLRVRVHLWRGGATLTAMHGAALLARRRLDWGRWMAVELTVEPGRVRLRVGSAPPVEVIHRTAGAIITGPVRCGVCHILPGAHLPTATTPGP